MSDKNQKSPVRSDDKTPEMPDVLRVANLQWNVRKRDFLGNIDIIDRLISKALDRNCNLISLPEMWSQSFCGQDLAKEAGFLENRLEALGARARKHDLWIAGGTLPEPAPDGRVYNTFHFIDPAGKVRYRFRKVRLFPFARETQYFCPPPSDQFPDVLVSGNWKVGAGVCFDIRFPDLFQRQMQQGANLFFIPSQIPMERIEHFVVLSRARALENMAYVIATNRCGAGNSAVFPGKSLIVDPLGMPISELGSDEDLGIGTIDAISLIEIRTKMPFLTLSPS